MNIDRASCLHPNLTLLQNHLKWLKGGSLTITEHQSSPATGDTKAQKRRETKWDQSPDALTPTHVLPKGFQHLLNAAERSATQLAEGQLLKTF